MPSCAAAPRRRRRRRSPRTRSGSRAGTATRPSARRPSPSRSAGPSAGCGPGSRSSPRGLAAAIAATCMPEAARWMSACISAALWYRSFGRLGHGLEHDRVRPRRHVRVEPGRRDRVLPHVLVGDRHRGVAGERRPAGEQLVHQAAGGVQVAARVHPLAPGLLRRQVLRGADDLGGLRHGGLGVAHRAGDAEVHHLDVAVLGDHDVPGLDVPVHDARLVAVLQCAQHPADDLERALAAAAGGPRSAGPGPSGRPRTPSRCTARARRSTCPRRCRTRPRSTGCSATPRTAPRGGTAPGRSGRVARSVRRVLIATTRSRRMSRARYTSAMPPRPTTPSSSYRSPSSRGCVMSRTLPNHPAS